MGYNLLGKKLTELRAKSGLTQAELAEKLHYTAQTVSNWERGVSSPGPETLLAMAEFFGVTTDELLGKESAAKEERAPLTESAQKRTERTEFYSEPTIAAFALRVLLWVSVGIAALLVLLVWLQTPTALAIFLGLSIGFRLLYLADFVVLMIAKKWVGSKVVKTFFLCALIGGNIVSFFTENVPELLYVQLALSLTFLITAPLVFCPAKEEPDEIRRGRVVYFVGVAILFLFGLISSIGGSAVFETLFLFGGDLYGICCLAAISKNREIQVPYQTNRTDAAALFSEPQKIETPFSSPPQTWVPKDRVIPPPGPEPSTRQKEEHGFYPGPVLDIIFGINLICWIFFALFSSNLITIAAVGTFVSIAFFALFWFVKEGAENRVLHWLSFAVWMVCMLASVYIYLPYLYGYAFSVWVFWAFEGGCLAVFIFVVLSFRGSLRIAGKAILIVLGVLLCGNGCFFGASGMENGCQIVTFLTIPLYIILFYTMGFTKKYREKPLRKKRKSNRE